MRTRAQGARQRQPLLILARDAAQAEALDELLWDFDEEAYLPHQIVGQGEDDDITPILIVSPGFETPDRPLVINLRDEVAPGHYDRVLEVVPADESARGPLRERWRQYQARGAQVQNTTCRSWRVRRLSTLPSRTTGRAR